MSEKKLMILQWLPLTIVILSLVTPQYVRANVDNVILVMPKGPRTLQMLGSMSPQLLHTISDVLKPVPSNVVQIPIPYYPEHPVIPTLQQQQQYPSHALHSAYFNSPFSSHTLTTTSFNSQPSPSVPTSDPTPSSFSVPINFDLKNIQPGPYDTPFIPKLKPSPPINPLHLEGPPEIRFTPVNLLPLASPSFDTIRSYVQKLKAKQKEFFDSQGFEYGLFTKPNTKPTSYHRPVFEQKPKKYPLKHKPSKPAKPVKPTKPFKPIFELPTKPSYENLFTKHPNELSYIGHANLSPQEEENVYYSEPDQPNKFYYANAEGHEFVIPPESDFKPIKLGGIIDPDDAHFVQDGDEFLLKTKHPNAAVVTPEELEKFVEYENKYGFSRPPQPSKQHQGPKFSKGLSHFVHHRQKRFKSRAGRANGDQDVDADFYDSDEGKSKFGELDFDDTLEEEEVKAYERFEPMKTYTQVRHQETSKKKEAQPKKAGEPKIKEKVIVSKTSIVYSEKGKEDEKFDHGAQESFGEFHSKSKTPKKHRSKRDVSEEPVVEARVEPVEEAHVEPLANPIKEAHVINNLIEEVHDEPHVNNSSEDAHDEPLAESTEEMHAEPLVEPAAEVENASTTDDSSESQQEFSEENSNENEIDYEYLPDPEYEEGQNSTDMIYLPYGQAVVFQNDTDVILLPIPEALIDPHDLQGEDLINFLDEAILNSTKFLPVEDKKNPIKVSPDIQKLQGEDLIQYLDEAIKTSNQYLINGPSDAIELVNPPQFGKITTTTEKPKVEIKADHVFEYNLEPPEPEEVHGEVVRFTQEHVLPDVPQFEVVKFAQPFKTLLKYHGNDLHEQDEVEEKVDYEIEIEAQNPRELNGVELLRYLDEAIDNTTYYIPEGYEERNHSSTPYLDRANHYLDVDTALKFADNVTSHVSDYLQDWIRRNKVESSPKSDSAESGFVPVEGSESAQEDTPTKQSKFAGVPDDAYKNSPQKQSNLAVVMYNDVIRHIKKHMSTNKKSKDRNILMIAVPRSLMNNTRSKSSRRNDDDSFDSAPQASLNTLPIFDINQFYPTIFPTEEALDFGKNDFKSQLVKYALEQEAESHVEQPAQPGKGHPHEQRRPIRIHIQGGQRFRGPHPGGAFVDKSYAVKERVRDVPVPAFKKPGPPYVPLPVPPVNPKNKLSALNTVTNQRAVKAPHPIRPGSRPGSRRRPHKRPPVKNLNRIPVVRKKVRFPTR